MNPYGRDGEMAEISAPDYGCLRGGMLLLEKIDYDLRNDWVGGNQGELTYADSHGGNGQGVAFIYRLQSLACRYHRRYTRGVEAKGDMPDRLAELQIDKVAERTDILTNQLEEGDIAGDLRSQLRSELGSILERWESDRSEEADQTTRPLLNS